MVMAKSFSSRHHASDYPVVMADQKPEWSLLPNKSMTSYVRDTCVGILGLKHLSEDLPLLF